MPRPIGLALALLSVAVCVIVATAPSPGWTEPAKPAADAPTFVGAAACSTCHQAEAKAWRGSHHDLAMAEATDTTVLGKFDGATFSDGVVTSRFFKRDGKFFVNTDGPDGKLADFEIRYTFGITHCSNI